jgi:hypothetical protein
MRDTIDMAREAGMKFSAAQFSGVLEAEIDEFSLKAFEALVRADEREACAKVCEETEVVQTTYCMTLHDEGAKTLCNAAAAIRARGNT